MALFLPYWQTTISQSRWSFFSFSCLQIRHPSRICSWPYSFQHLYITSFYHLLFPWYFSATICWWHSTIYSSIAPSSISVEISKLTLCLTSLHSWFSHNGLALNADKSESILLGTRQRSHSYRDVTSVNVADAIVPLTDHVKLLGVTLDSHLTFDKHVNVLTKTCFYHIRAFRHIRPAITEDMAKLVACSLVGSRLDDANSALYGASKLSIRRLQRIQNIVARVVVGSATYISLGATATLRRLHWLCFVSFSPLICRQPVDCSTS